MMHDAFIIQTQIEELRLLGHPVMVAYSNAFFQCVDVRNQYP